MSRFRLPLRALRRSAVAVLRTPAAALRLVLLVALAFLLAVYLDARAPEGPPAPTHAVP